jgi:diguanylate cyclase (GGDEF)-like protein
MGGDEFAVLLLESDPETGALFLERLRDRIDELIGLQEMPDLVALSAGLAHYPTDGRTPDALFRVADSRLYEAKRANAR